MIILTLRTDKPESELAIFDDLTKLIEIKWLANRILADTIHLQIKKLLDDQNLSWQDIKGVVCYRGPGSFTGLRIGLSVANALAYGLQIPIVGKSTANWQILGIKDLLNGNNDKIALPEYGGEIKITKPKK
ncbi:MAG: tRNA (adenosine(37)-N6)-threonylcarbamoyltransferase complex dimerization subunit type 1 TsaB [Candidatus Saccharibacteria bacterium]